MLLRKPLVNVNMDEMSANQRQSRQGAPEPAICGKTLSAEDPVPAAVTGTVITSCMLPVGWVSKRSASGMAAW